MKEKRTLIIGDIHGNVKALNGVLKNANFNIEEDRIICIGDYIDGWNESVEVVNTLLEIKNKSKFKNVFLLGNHDKWFVDILNKDFKHFRNEYYIRSKYSNWYLQGGKTTYEAYLKRSDEDILRHKNEFFDQLRYYHEESNKLFVHAGFDLELGFKETLIQNKDELIWNRTLYKKALNNWIINQSLIQMKTDPIAAKIEHYDKIYIGHSPTVKDLIFKPKLMGNVINVDQGCKKRGILTAWIDELDEFYQNV